MNSPGSPSNGNDGPVGHIVVLAESVGATQTISFAQPLALPSERSSGRPHRLSMLADDKAWDDEAGRRALLDRLEPTVLVLSRYGTPRALAMLQQARRRGVPVLFHIDDDLLDVPMSLGKAKYDFYHQPERLACLRATMDTADGVYASTGPLARRLAEHGIRSPIVAGDLYCSPAPGTPPVPLPATVPVIGYMGTGGHSQDLALVMPAIVALMRQWPELRFETFGTIKPPAEMAAFPGRYAHHPGVADYDGFLEKLGGLGWWVGLAPLEDNPFNRCKADTKWVEYTWCGMAVVAADLPVYHRACSRSSGLLARDVDDWREAIASLLRSEARRHAQVQAARDHLRLGYDRGRLRQQVLDVIGSLSSRPSTSASTTVNTPHAT
ncbi:MAG: glycosyltransferase [Rubrivivax sp.]|nr:glycosyltransferase [Rubrivivax sp.]